MNNPLLGQDRVRELSQIRTPEEFAVWKQQQTVTSELINEIRSAVRRFAESGDFDSAYRVSDWLVLLAADVDDLMTRARAIHTRAVTLLRANQAVRAFGVFR